MNSTKLFFIVALLGLAPCLAATAQDSAPASKVDAAADAKTARYAVLTGDNVNVRTAASVEGGYPILKLKTGDLVEVVLEKYGWTNLIYRCREIRD